MVHIVKSTNNSKYPYIDLLVFLSIFIVIRAFVEIKSIRFIDSTIKYIFGENSESYIHCENKNKCKIFKQLLVIQTRWYTLHMYKKSVLMGVKTIIQSMSHGYR